ncbi:MAG: hypothetical protein ACTHLX_19415, partial [Candidatus Binatia bacterium]
LNFPEVCLIVAAGTVLAANDVHHQRRSQETMSWQVGSLEGRRNARSLHPAWLQKQKRIPG